MAGQHVTHNRSGIVTASAEPPLSSIIFMSRLFIVLELLGEIRSSPARDPILPTAKSDPAQDGIRTKPAERNRILPMAESDFVPGAESDFIIAVQGGKAHH